MDENTAWVPELVPLDLIDSNPWQGRLDDDPVHVKTLAEDIAENTLLQPGLGRRVNGRVQIAFAHSRLAAFKFLHETFGTPGNGQAGALYRQFPVILRELTDRQMSDYAAAENAKRKNLTSIETAQAIQKRMRDFGLTQLEAAVPFGYKNQSSVANLLRLLELPEPLQGQVARGELAERHARQLIGLARLKPGKAIEIARKVVESGDPDDTLADSLEEFLDKTGGDLDESDIPLEWVPDAPVAIEGEFQQFDFETLPSCARCPNYMRFKYHSYCARLACMKAKRQAWMQLELERISAKTGIPVAQPGEKAKALSLNYSTANLAKSLMKVKIKPDCLRLIPNGGSVTGYFYHKNVTDSDVVLLASTDANILSKEKAALDKVKPTKEKGSPAPAPAKEQIETPEQKRKRIEREKAEEAARDARRVAASQQHKVMHDMAWLIFNTADRLAPQMTISPAGLLQEVLDIHRSHTHPPMTNWPQYNEPYKALDDAVEKATGKDNHLLSCKLLIARELGNNVSGYRAEEQFDWPGALEDVKGLAENWGLKLPAGWDQPPIHKTRCNCHVCGKFTSQDHITRVDESAGWVVDTSLVPEGFVTCSPECRNDDAMARLSGFSARATKATAKKSQKGKR